MKKGIRLLILCLFFMAASVSAASQNDFFRVLDISERTYDNGPAIAVLFSAPLSAAKRSDSHISISDGRRMLKSAWVLSDDRMTLYFPNVEPETAYSVTVSDTITSAAGQPLEQRVEKVVTTRNVTPVVSFAGDGLLLPAKMTSGLPVVSVNVKTVDVEFFRLNDKGLAEFMDWRSPGGLKSTYMLDDAQNYSDLVFSGRFDLDIERNRRVICHIPVEGIEALQAPGVYMAVMRRPGEYKYSYQGTYFMVTDIGVHARIYTDEALIITSSLKTGKPLAGVGLTFCDRKGATVKTAVTDEQGAVRCPENIIAKTGVIKARKGNHVSVLSLSVPALDLSEFDLGERVHRNRDIFIYSPRDLYRPGDTVRISALLRDDDGSPVPPMSLSARLIRPDGRMVREFMLRPESGEKAKMNYFQASFAIAGNAQTGLWRLELRDNPELKMPSGLFRFHVEDFLPERMKLDLASDTSSLSGSSSLQVDVSGMYLYGAPASGNRISSRVSLSAKRDIHETLKGFEFGNIDDALFRDSWERDDAALDESGHAGLDVKDRWSSIKSPVRIRTAVSLYESGGRPVTRSIDCLYRPSANLVGIRPLFDVKSTEAGPVSFEFIKVSPDGSPVPSKALLLTLVKEDRDYYWEYSDGTGWDYKYTEKRYTVTTDSVALKAAPAKYGMNLSYGRYLLKVRDPETDLVTSIRFWVGYWSDDDGMLSAARPDKVRLDLDKAAYRSGDVVNLTVKPPHDGYARILVEADRPLWTKALSVKSSGTVVRIPVSAAWKRHDIYISAVVFRPGDAKEKITPNRAVGLVHLPLERSERRVDISIEAPEKVRPFEPVEIAFSTETPAGKTSGPVFVTLAAVDAGILSITDFKTPDPFAWFFSQRRFSVDSYDLYGKVIEITDGPLAKLRYGGDADLASGGKRPETLVRLVSLFQGPVELDENGRGVVTLDIPDFNGRLRLMAVAFGTGTFGSAEREMTVAAPVVTQLSMPRFLAPGDRTELALDVRNMSGKPQNLNIQLKAEAPLALDDGSRSFSLADAGKKVLRFPVSVGNTVGASVIRMSLEGEDIDIQRTWQLGARPGYPADVRKVRAFLEKGDTFRLDRSIAGDMIPSTVEADVLFSPSLSINTGSELSDLLAYPYGCLEQTISAAFPLVFLNGDGDLQPGSADISPDERSERLNRAVERLQGMHLASGGFGLWSGRSPEDPWLTVYAADFLLAARSAGIYVPPSMLKKSLKRLQFYLNRSVPLRLYGESGKEYAFAVKAYAANVLAGLRQAPLGTLRVLYDKHRDDAVSSLSLAFLGDALRRMGDMKLGREAIAAALETKRDESGYIGDYGSPLRDTALSAVLYMDNDIAGSDLQKVLVEMDTLLRSRRWLSTQEKFALFRAGMAFKALEGRQWSGRLKYAGKKEDVSRQGPLALKPSAEDIRKGVVLKSYSDDYLFASAVVSGYTKTPPKKYDQYIRIKREFLDPDGNVSVKERYNVGELVVVHLAVEADLRIPDALVADLLPAGFEMENRNLQHSVKIDDIGASGGSMEDLQKDTGIIHEEFRDDRYVAAVKLEKDRTAHLFYLVRAVSPGTFTVPPPFAESMYRPDIRGIGETPEPVRIVNAVAGQ